LKAIVYTEYGPPEVLQVKEIEKPAPKVNEILIRIAAAPVNFGDTYARNFGSISPGEFSMPFLMWLPARLAIGLNKPNNPVLGSEFAGEVAAVGAQVTRFKPGDAVFGYRGQRMGTYAEYLCMPEKGLVAHRPTNLSDAEAATIPYGALTAMSLLRKVDLHPGSKVLINGASGGIGSAAVQLAKNAGAEVTGVCGTPRLDYVKALGADHVIDYTQEDFTQNGQTYDLIFDIIRKTSFERCQNSLKEGGVYLLASFKMRQLGQMLRTSPGGGKKVVCALSSESLDDLLLVKDLVEAGKFTTAIDRTFPMDQAAAAHRYAESGQERGKIVITLGTNGKG